VRKIIQLQQLIDKLDLTFYQLESISELTQPRLIHRLDFLVEWSTWSINSMDFGI